MLHRYYKSFWSHRFLNLFCASIFLTLIISGAFYCLSPVENPLKGGDFLAFYTAGKIALENPNLLYSLNFQATLQESLYHTSGYHVFAYPPFVAIFYEPFALLAPLTAKLVYLLLLLLSLFASVVLLKKQSSLPITTVQLLAFCLLFSPLTTGISSGQNTAFSFLLLVLISYLAKNTKWFLVGTCVAVWNFKPQYSVIAFSVIFLLSNNRTRFLLGYLLVSVTQLLISLFVFGKDVFLGWLDLLRRLAEMNNNSLANVAKMTSLPSLYRAGSVCCPALSLILVTALVLMLFEICRRNRSDYLIVGLIVALLSPQTGFYDLALVLPFVITKLGNLLSPFIWKYCFFCLVIYLSTLAQTTLKIQLLPLVSVIFLASISLKLTNRRL